MIDPAEYERLARALVFARERISRARFARQAALNMFKEAEQELDTAQEAYHEYMGKSFQQVEANAVATSGQASVI